MKTLQKRRNRKKLVIEDHGGTPNIKLDGVESFN